jgi:hypothetical protein
MGSRAATGKIRPSGPATVCRPLRLAAVAAGIFYGMTPLERDLEKSLLDLYEKWLTNRLPGGLLQTHAGSKGGVASVKHLLAGNIKGEFPRRSVPKEAP